MNFYCFVPACFKHIFGKKFGNFGSFIWQRCDEISNFEKPAAHPRHLSSLQFRWNWVFSEKFLHFLFVFFILTFRLCFEVLQVIECKFNLILIFWNGFILDQHFKYFNNLCVSIFSFLHCKISTLYNDFVVVKLLSLRLK